LTDDHIYDDPKPRAWRATDLKRAEQPRWLAKGRLPQGAVSILVGEEGIGKSLLWVHVAAAVTTGKPLPEFGVPARKPGHVLVVITEDDWSTTVLPRLTAAGADLDYVQVICTEDDGSGSPMFPRDIDLVRDADPVPAFVVVDAWLDTVPSNLSVKDPQGARQALHPWRDIGITTDASILLLTHTNRSTTGSARDKYGATSELRKKARMTLFAQRDENGDLTVGPEKSNTTGKLPATIFRIDPVAFFEPTDDYDGTIPVLRYVGESERTAGEILESMTQAAVEGDDADEIGEWLSSFLSDGPDGRQAANDVYAAAETAGYSKDQAKRAKRRLGVEPEKRDGGWFWRLPQGSGQGGSISEERSLTPFLVRECVSSAPLDGQGSKGARERGVQTRTLDRPLDVWRVSGTPVGSREGF
jgi:hypothetical protein